MHVSTVSKCDDVKDSFHEELGHVFDQFPVYYMRILLEDFNAKVEMENIFRPTFWKDSLHETS